MKLLIVEDDKVFAQTLKRKLADDYAVDLAFSVADGDYQAHTYDYDVIVLDIHLPDGDGVKLCDRLRKDTITTPILMLTAESEPKEKVAALDTGADDYLTKPFILTELQARLRALMRRPKSSLNQCIFAFEKLNINIITHQVFHSGKPVKLRRKEFAILEYLLRNQGAIITRSMILDHIWDSEDSSDTNTVDVHIKLLRDKVDRPFDTHYIKTVYGVGYKID